MKKPKITFKENRFVFIQEDFHVPEEIPNYPRPKSLEAEFTARQELHRKVIVWDKKLKTIKPETPQGNHKFTELTTRGTALQDHLEQHNVTPELQQEFDAWTKEINDLERVSNNKRAIVAAEENFLKYKLDIQDLIANKYENIKDRDKQLYNAIAAAYVIQESFDEEGRLKADAEIEKVTEAFQIIEEFVNNEEEVTEEKEATDFDISPKQLAALRKNPKLTPDQINLLKYVKKMDRHIIFIGETSTEAVTGPIDHAGQQETLAVILELFDKGLLTIDPPAINLEEGNIRDKIEEYCSSKDPAKVYEANKELFGDIIFNLSLAFNRASSIESKLAAHMTVSADGPYHLVIGTEKGFGIEIEGMQEDDKRFEDEDEEFEEDEGEDAEPEEVNTADAQIDNATLPTRENLNWGQGVIYEVTPEDKAGILAMLEEEFPEVFNSEQRILTAYNHMVKQNPNINKIYQGDYVTINNGILAIERKNGDIESWEIFPFKDETANS